MTWGNIKNFAGLKGLTTIGVTDLSGNAISAGFWFYLASLLGAENYGHVSYLLAVAGIASTLSLTGASNTLTVYTAKNIRLESSVYFISLIFAAIAVVVLVVLFSDYGVGVYVIGAVVFGLASSEILGKKLYKSYPKYIIVQRLLMIGLAIGLYHLMGLNGIILGLGLAFLVYLPRIILGFKETRVNFSLLRERFSFIFHNYIWSLSTAFSGQFDKLIVAPFLGFEILGNYQLGIQLLAVLEMLPNVIFKFILPQDASGNSNKKLKRITILSAICLAAIGIVMSPILIPHFFPKFTPAIQVFQIVSLSLIPSTINLTFISKFLGMEKSKLVLVSSGVYLTMQIILILTLGKAFGINGVATAFVISVCSQTVSLLIMDRTLLRTIGRT